VRIRDERRARLALAKQTEAKPTEASELP